MLFLTLIYTASIFLCLRASVHVWGYITCPEPLIGRVKENTVNNPCPITPPSRHHLYIIHLVKKGIPCINKLHCFYRITIPLKLPLVPRRDVKQCPTTNPTALLLLQSAAGCAIHLFWLQKPASAWYLTTIQ